MKFLTLILLFVAVSCDSISNIPFDPELGELWEAFKRFFDKSYTGNEEIARRLIWEQTIEDVIKHDLEADLGIQSYRRGINRFSDLTTLEYKKWTGFRGMNSSTGNASTWLEPMNIDIPASVDWRQKGYVTEVKDQRRCGSCWAFSATGSLEGQHFKKTGNLVSLSEQNLVACSLDEGNMGCQGGLMTNAFEYVKKNHGIDTEKSYPYTGMDGYCYFNKTNIGATCTGYVNLPPGDEAALKNAVATIGPISVGINAPDSLYSYKSGIYDDKSCKNRRDDLDHAVLIVGYGNEGGKDYWLVKNSWGPDWGLNGYIKMSRNKENQCGIATSPTYPLV